MLIMQFSSRQIITNPLAFSNKNFPKVGGWLAVCLWNGGVFRIKEYSFGTRLQS